jgi:serine phosphatase RsbU (regulator of sigma subunit)
VLQTIAEFTNSTSQNDDITIIALKYVG